MAAKAKRAPRKKNGYQMPDPISAGEILTDLSKGQWILGKSIGVGGFGEVYSGMNFIVNAFATDYLVIIIGYPRHPDANVNKPACEILKNNIYVYKQHIFVSFM